MPDYIYLLENRLSPAQRNALQLVRDIARDASMTVFLAGGAVRDLTSGSSVRDLDFTVQGNALKLLKKLEKSGVVLLGEHEPSRSMSLWFPGSVRVEVSTTRREEYPKPVKRIYHWVTIHEDLRRRDFTANAMALSLNESSYGLLLDPLNGVADIEARLLRLASNYGFLEDPSRLVRAWRLHHRLGWELEERTLVRYQNAKEEGVISAIPHYLLGVEIEAIAHEEDALGALKALEAEGWMKHLDPAWTSAKADSTGLAALHRTLTQLQIQGVYPDPSAAQMELLTAKMQPKELAGLKKLFPNPGFMAQWESLESDAKEFARVLSGKDAASPSATWKLLTSYQAEPVLWLAFSSKSAPVQTKFNNFFNVWPDAKQRVPLALLLEMRITPELPGYDDLLQEIFFHLIDGQLQTEEEMRAFLEPYSPPAPPAPVNVRKTRGRRAERVRIEEELEEETDLHEDAELAAESEDDMDEERPESDDAPPPPKPALKSVLPGEKTTADGSKKGSSSTSKKGPLQPAGIVEAATSKQSQAAPKPAGKGKAAKAVPAPKQEAKPKQSTPAQSQKVAKSTPAKAIQKQVKPVPKKVVAAKPTPAKKQAGKAVPKKIASKATPKSAPSKAAAKSKPEPKAHGKKAAAKKKH